MGAKAGARSAGGSSSASAERRSDIVRPRIVARNRRGEVDAPIRPAIGACAPPWTSCGQRSPDAPRRSMFRRSWRRWAPTPSATSTGVSDAVDVSPVEDVNCTALGLRAGLFV